MKKWKNSNLKKIGWMLQKFFLMRQKNLGTTGSGLDSGFMSA